MPLGFAALLGLVLSPPATALEGDTLRPFVEASLGYDTNLFRFADDQEARSSSIGEPIKSILFRRYGAGVDVDWKQGRQQVVGHLAANQTSFSRYSSLLDYSGRDMKGEWKWQLGNRWSGSLYFAQDYSLEPYTEQLSGQIKKNLRADNTAAFQADYWLHPDWRARLRLDQFKRRYDESDQEIRNYKRKTATAGLYRQGGTLERLGVEYVTTRGDYFNRPVTPTVDNRSDEDALRLVGSWAMSGVTTLSGYVGYAKRTHPKVDDHDFSGLEWRLNARWLPTGKTLVEAAIYRDLGESEEQGVDYNQVDAVSLTASWQAFPKTRLIGQARYERDTYEGSQREDDTLTTTLSAAHEAWRSGEISAGWQYTRRTSNYASLEYMANTLFLSANLKF